MRRTMISMLVGALVLALTAGAALASADGGTSGGTAERTTELGVKRVNSGPDGALERRQIVIASSARALSAAIGEEVPHSGRGTYVAAFWGEKPTGGYSVAVREASRTGDRVSVRLALREPAPGMVVTTALTHPYAIAVVKDLNPQGRRFSFFEEDGQRLDWTVRRVSG